MSDRPSEYSPEAWNELALNLLAQDDQIPWRRYCDALYVSLLDRWLPPGEDRARRALKTDLYDEAVDEGLVSRLGQSSRQVFGLDLSFPIVHTADRRHVSLRVALTDVRALPYRAASFDLVLSNSTLDHFPTTEQIDVALAEIARVTRAGGTLIISLDNLGNPIIRLRQFLPSSPLRRIGLTAYYVGVTHDRKGMVAALERAGFRIQELTAVMHCPRVAMIPLARALSGSNRAASRFVRVLMSWEQLEKLPTRYLSGHYLAAKAVRLPASAIPDA